jgi:hypothetical protein
VEERLRDQRRSNPRAGALTDSEVVKGVEAQLEASNLFHSRHLVISLTACRDTGRPRVA